MTMDDQLLHMAYVQTRQESPYGLGMTTTGEPLGIRVKRHATRL